jgi:hypothetical protein
VNDGVFRLGFVGRLSPEKNVRMLAAIPELPRFMPSRKMMWLKPSRRRRPVLFTIEAPPTSQSTNRRVVPAAAAVIAAVCALFVHA